MITTSPDDTTPTGGATRPPVAPNELYKHYKGNTYKVLIADATNTETGEPLVVYAADTPEDPHPKIWARPASMFLDNVTTTEGSTVQRFQKLKMAKLK